MLVLVLPQGGPWLVAPSLARPLDNRSDFAARLLAGQNSERLRLGLAPLAWDEGLAADARGWGEELARRHAFQHAPAELRGDEGENLFQGTADYYPLEEMVADFLAERDDFHPGRFPDVANDGVWEHVGHYTQIISRHTRSVGCALVSADGWDTLVCRYAPAGNVVGERVP